MNQEKWAAEIHHLPPRNNSLNPHSNRGLQRLPEQPANKIR